MNTSSANPFTLLGLQPRFDLDPQQLQRAFLKAGAANHPDRFTDPDEQDEAVRRSAQINAAHRQLKDPLDRAQILLDLLGSSNQTDGQALPDGFLFEMLEIREQVSDAQDADNQPQLEQLKQWAQQQRDQHLKTIAQHFDDALAANTLTDPVAQQINIQLNALRYIERMIEQLDPDHSDLP
ncbi:MAG: Fe-S protein assembly co-chaperone HscB [Planctomycetaceae bacterium]|nr:Fe-S protein assembly co-chaperone HscB [Planctomycetaceae bacterium]